jgi:hypothetical protein
MVNMICVGGPAAGMLVQVEPSRDSIKVLSKCETEFNSRSMVSSTLEYEVYTVRTFAFTQSKSHITEEICYLALASWTDMQAVNHFLEYYRNYSE